MSVGEEPQRVPLPHSQVSWSDVMRRSWETLRAVKSGIVGAAVL